MYGIIVRLLQPFGCLMWGGLVSLALLWWRRPDLRRTLRWPIVIYGMLFLDALPLTALLTNSILESRFDRVTRRPAETRAIVVLGGGAISPAVEGEPMRPDDASLRRTLRAAELYRDGPRCPLIVSGGKPDPSEPGDSPGRTMVEVLIHAGVHRDDVILEEDSRNTAENAAATAKILQARGLTDGVLLVTSAAHLGRAERLFRRQGISVIPAGCNYHTDELSVDLFLLWPTSSAIRMNQDVFHEALGFVTYWGRGLL